MTMKSLLIVLLVYCCGSKGVQIPTHDTGSLFPHAAARRLHDFAFDMYGKISANLDSDENMVFGPISMYSVLSVLVPGLNGRTLSQVERALRTYKVRNSLKEESAMCKAIFTDSPSYVLNQTNRVYIDESFQLIPTFKAATARYHKASIKELNFHEHPRQSRSRINRFVAKQTRNDITNFIPEGGVTSLTKMFLVNTVYMEAQWKHAFREDLTRLQPFQVSSTEVIQVLTMFHSSAKCVVSLSPELNSKIVVLPFKENSLSMVVFEPSDVGNFAPFEHSRSADQIVTAMHRIWDDGKLRYSSCRVTMPKFSMKYAVEDMKRILKQMGIQDIFAGGRADFSKLSKAEDLYVSDASHEAVMKVDEGGVKASAASGIVVSVRMMAPPVDLNKPFLFLIRHDATGAVLFVGKVVRPQFTE